MQNKEKQRLIDNMYERLMNLVSRRFDCLDDIRMELNVRHGDISDDPNSDREADYLSYFNFTYDPDVEGYFCYDFNCNIWYAKLPNDRIYITEVMVLIETVARDDCTHEVFTIDLST